MSSLAKTYGQAYTHGVLDASNKIKRNPYEKQTFVDGWQNGYDDLKSGKVRIKSDGQWEIVNV